MAAGFVTVGPDNKLPAAVQGELNATYASLPAVSDLMVFVSPNGDDTANGLSWGSAFATIEKAVQTVTPGGGTILLSGGTHTAPTTGLPSNTHVRGIGKGATVIALDIDQRASCLMNADHVNGNQNITVRDLTLDGGRYNDTTTAPNEVSDYGLLFNGCGRLTLQNVEAKNCRRNGILINGLALATSRYFWLTNVEAHHNQEQGIHVGDGSRGCYYTGVTAYENDVDGVWFDHSESFGNGIHAYGNGGMGIFIRNVFLCSINNIKADRNGGHGIYVWSLTNSVGSNWSAQGNGVVTAGSSDIYFVSDPYYYGTNRETVITGVKAGPATGNTAYRPPFNVPQTEDYAIYVEDGHTEDFRLLDVLATPGVLGTVRKNAADTRFIVEDQVVPRSVATSSIARTVANTTVEDAIVSYVIPANTVRPGDHYRVKAAGVIDNADAGGNLNFRLRVGGIGGTLIAQVNINPNGDVAAIDKPFVAEFDLICRSMDAAGTATWTATGVIHFDYTSVPKRLIGSATATRGTAGDAALNFDVQWVVANAGNVLTCETASIEKLN